MQIIWVWTEIPFSAPHITRRLIHLNQAAYPVWDQRPVPVTVFYHLPQKDAEGTVFLGSPLANVHLTFRSGKKVRMLVLSMKAGEAVAIGHDIPVVAVTPDVPYRHHYRCWLCKWEGVLEFEPDAAEPSWTECHYCGLHNEIAPGWYDRPALIPGHVPSRMF